MILNMNVFGKHLLLTVYIWAIPPGWGTICDGVNCCYIHECTRTTCILSLIISAHSVVLHIQMNSISPPSIGNYNNFI